MSSKPSMSIDDQTEATKRLTRELTLIVKQAELPTIALSALMTAAMTVAHEANLHRVVPAVFDQSLLLLRNLSGKQEICDCPDCKRQRANLH